MAVGEISSSAFEFYEGLRVVISGAVAVGLYSAVAGTFGTPAGALGANTLAAIIAGLLVGVFLLFLDVPAKAAVASFEAPVAHIQSWQGVAPSPGASYLNVYFEVLDAEFPAGIRDRTHYLGAIYRIGFEAIYLSAASLGVLSLAVLFPSVGINRATSEDTTLRWIFVAGAVLHGAIAVGAIRARYYEHQRKRRPARQRLFDDLLTEIPWGDRMLLAGGVAGIAWFSSGGPRWVGGAGVAVPALIWAFRYYFGVRGADGGKSQNLHGVTAAVLFGIAAISVCACGLARATGKSPLSVAVAVGWLSLSIVAALLVAARGHEKRLLGSYGIQRAWLSQNRDQLISKGYFVETEATGDEAPESFAGSWCTWGRVLLQLLGR
jgi:hypothetical protein